MSIRNNLTAIIFVLSTLFAKGQTQIWPFRDANGGVLRGNVTGVVGEFRADGTNARFHGGVDFTSPLPVTIGNKSLAVPNSGRAVFSMHAGTATVVYSPSDCWNSYVRITLQDGNQVYYKHIKPSTTNPVTNQTVSAIVDGTQVQPGAFLGVMFGDDSGEGDCSVHVHINQNSGGGSLPGSTNFINQFVNPFNDTERPEFFYPFSGGGSATDNSAANGYRIAEFRRNGHTRTNITDQLGESVRIDGTIHKNAYGKLDIVSRLRDIHIGLDGGRKLGGDGNSGINGASYEILDNAGRTVLTEVQNLNFNSVPSNDNGNYVFDSRSNKSNHIYIISNNPTAANGRYDQFWNSGLRIGQTEDWDLSSRGEKDARSIQEAAYPDGKYIVRIRAKDITNFNGGAGILIRDVPTVVDNYLPYVKEIIVKQTSSIGPVVYHKKWDWDATTGQLNFTINDKPNDATPLGKLWVKVVTSEPMKTLKLTISGNDPGPVITDPTPVANTNNKEFIKEYSAIFGSGRQTITIAGTDLADNILLTDPTQNSLRLADGTWPPSATQGTDTSHSFMIGTNTCASNFPGGRTDGTECLYVEYSASNSNIATNEPVVFTPIVSGTGTVTYSWNFGAGATPATATTAGPHTVMYSSTGTKTVTLTVTDGTGTKTKSGSVNVLTNSPSVDFSATPTSGTAPLTVNYSDRSAGTVSSRSWSFPGGTPSTSTAANPVVVYNTAGNYDATLTVNGTATTTKQSIISVNSPQPLTVSISHCSNYYFVNCAGSYNQYSFVYFDSNISGGSPLYNYYWNFGDGNTSTTSTPVNTYSTSGTITVTLTVTDRNGATATASTSVNIASVTPTINANWNVTGVDSNGDGLTYLSAGEGSLTFTDASAGNVNFSTVEYYWDFGTGSYPRFAYTKGPHEVCFDDLENSKTVYLRLRYPASNTYGEKRANNHVYVQKGNLDKCSATTPRWQPTPGAASGGAVQTCLWPGQNVGIKNGDLAVVSCDVYSSKSRDCVFESPNPCLGEPWFSSHGTVSMRSDQNNCFRLWSGGRFYVSTKQSTYGTEGIFYQHSENFRTGKRYDFTFSAKVSDYDIGNSSNIHHLRVSLTNGLLPNNDCISDNMPSYSFNLHDLGSFEYAINTRTWKCYEVYFYAPNSNFNQIWIYPMVEGTWLSQSKNSSIDSWVLLDNFSLRSGESSDCAPDLVVSSSTPGLTQSAFTLKTQGTVVIPNTQSTTYRAGEVISLKPGFKASSGSTFRALTGECGTTVPAGRIGQENEAEKLSPNSITNHNNYQTDYLGKSSGEVALEPSNDDVYKESPLTIAPNPANDKITVSVNLKGNSSVEITIVSLIGVIADSRSINEAQSINEEFIIQQLPSGVYLLKVKSDEGVMVKKFVKL